MPLSSIENQQKVEKKEEGDFMSSLLAGLDETFFASPTPTPSSSGTPSSKLFSSWTPTPKQPIRRSCGAEIVSINRSNNSSSSSKRILSSPTKSISSNKKRQTRLSFPSSLKLSSPGSPSQSINPFMQERKRTPLSNSQTRVIEEDDRKAANELLLASDDWDNFEPSPKKVVVPAAAVVTQALQTQTIDKGSFDLTDTSERYVRCIVDFVSRSTYIPERYRTAPEGKHTTKGVKDETVHKIMRKDQIVLDLQVLSRKGEEISEQTRRKVYLRDEWLQTHISSGDIVHLIGTWTIPNAPDRIEIALEDEFEEDLDLSPEVAKTPFMIISSDTFTRSHDNRSEADNLIILHPDVLLSATAISSVVSCARKPLLQAKIKQSGPGIEDKPTEALVMGRMLHEVLQSCLTGQGKELPKGFEEDFGSQQHNFQLPSTFPQIWNGPFPSNFSEDFVKRQIVNQVRTSLDDLLHAGMETIKAIERLWEMTLPFGPFATVYLGTPGPSVIPIEPNPLAEAIDSRSSIAPLIRVLQIYDVEEDIWSPMYGLKGFVDVSVEVQITERGSDGKQMQKNAIPCSYSTKVMMPLELKTGRSINMIEHRAQTMLYTLMMSDRYRRKIDCGLLYYSKSAELHVVRTARNEIRGLILARNELARYMTRKEGTKEEESIQAVMNNQKQTELPPTIDDERTCSRCYVSDACMLYQKATTTQLLKEEEGSEDLSDWPLYSLYQKYTSHLTGKHATFFKHWNHLLTLEEADVVKHRREIWTMTASSREQAGRCFGNMVLSQKMPTKTQKENAIQLTTGMNKCIIYGFKRAKNQRNILLGGNMSVGDAICISIEPSLLSIAQGFLLELSPHHILVGLDKSLQPILKRAGENQKQAIFRIDREEQVSGMARIRYNLAKLFFAPPAGDTRRRELIVDLRKPEFTTNELIDQTQSLTELQKDLNFDQINAIDKVLSAEDYALIIGMPGTGKTTTIAKLITLLAKRGKSVLLASYTHSAVDTICRKLIGVEGVNLLRLGNSDRIHLDVQGNILKQSSTVEQLQSRLLEPNVVATTCLSIGHTLFALRNTFDYCIIDEASQITLPACIGPLRYANKFVLVGDPNQLPPLVRDFRARKEGLDVSLFEHLQRAHPHSVVHLCHQYRMNEDIMSLSNELIYQGKLQCGNEKVAKSTVFIPNLERSMESMHPSKHQDEEQCWIRKALSSETRTLFINTHNANAFEQRTGDLVENLFEAKMVWQLCLSLIFAGVEPKEIAILTPYRQQIKRINALLHHHQKEDLESINSEIQKDLSKIEIWTADKAQGRDKDIIIVSLVRSTNQENGTSDSSDLQTSSSLSSSVGQLLHDIRRINVALTRARKKLILIGDRNTLANAPILAKLWSIMHSKGWTLDLTKDQLNSHKECQDENQFIPPPHPPTSSPSAFFNSA